jgi:SAM-dependent methyltransferase
MTASRVRVNLGSGNEPMSGWINVDRRLVAGVNVVADVTQLPFRDRSVDEVLASSLLEHFKDPYEVLDSIHRVLAPTATFSMRVPSPWAYSGILDTTHFFLADLKLWREILGGYFERVDAAGEGVRHRDHKPLAALLHFCVKVLRMTEFAQTWLLRCERPRAQTRRAYIPWWLEERYGRDPRMQQRVGA